MSGKSSSTLVSPSAVKRGRSSTTETVSFDVPPGDKMKIKPNGEVDVAPAKKNKTKKDKSATTEEVILVEEGAFVQTCNKLKQCPALILFIVFSVIVICYMVWRAFNLYPGNGCNSKKKMRYFMTVGLSAVVTLVVLFFFGWWIKQECNSCQPGRSWLVFILAIILPFVLGFLFDVVTGAVNGGANYVSHWFKKSQDEDKSESATASTTEKKATKKHDLTTDAKEAERATQKFTKAMSEVGQMVQ